ncbi:hypothetical protein I552_9534 [Mycobacterium xenopi 3993]|nr:hypothetical protein I552_9534 [Mycobacterium xenopi 3993]
MTGIPDDRQNRDAAFACDLGAGRVGGAGDRHLVADALTRI